MIACLIANANRDSKRRKTPFTIEEFMPTSKPKEQSPEDIMAMARAWNAAAGGREVVNG